MGENTILANSHCSYVDPSSYNTLLFTNFIVSINKFLQIAMFSAYLVYLYKFNLNVHAAQVTLRYSRKLFRIATAMGAIVGLSLFIYILAIVFTRIFRCSFYQWRYLLTHPTDSDYDFLHVH